MRRVLATDLGIWPMIKNQEWASEMMISTPDYWARVADYLLLYDQVIIPTGNLQILPILRLMLGEDAVDELLLSRTIVLARFDQWFGYVGKSGVVFFKIQDNPDIQGNKRPNLAKMHFKSLDQTIDDVLIATNPPSSPERRGKIKKILLDNVVILPTAPILRGVREEAYTDIRESPYLRDFLALRNTGRTLDNLVGSKPDELTVFNPHVPAEPNDPPEIRALLRVVFENLLLSLGGHCEATELTGDSSSLSVLQAKGQRIGFSPDGRQAFAQIQKVSGVPNLGTAFAKKQITSTQILDLRSSPHAQALRDWLSNGFPAEEAEATVARYVETIGKPSLIDRLPAKILRFAATTTWGEVESISGTLAAAADTFFLSKWFPGRSPRLLMRKAKAVLANSPVIRRPSIKGRDRNTFCLCGSGKKLKHCCG